jgi:dTDP-4-dehydrorhamnose reductase
MRVLVTGFDGQVARSLRETASGDPSLTMKFAARPELDLSDPTTISSVVQVFRPDLVINPAAYTAVDKAESEPDLAMAINRDGAGAVAAAAADLGIPIIHLSTDYVFDGRKTGPYDEDDPVAPQGVYGQTKLEGERAVARANPKHVILRTAWVYAPFGANFVRTMIRLAAERDALRVVDDQVGCPTYAPDIAAAVLAIANQINETDWRDDYAGVTHLAGPDETSWCGFARAIVSGGVERGGRPVPVEAIFTSDFPTPAKRPANSRLSTNRLSDVFDIKLPPLQASLGNCLDRLVGARTVAAETPS